jgi:hypothetical protein
MTNNYLKTTALNNSGKLVHSFHFFDEREPSQQAHAFALARTTPGCIVYRRPAGLLGWKDVPAVGDTIGDLAEEPKDEAA